MTLCFVLATLALLLRVYTKLFVVRQFKLSDCKADTGRTRFRSVLTDCSQTALSWAGYILSSL